MIILALTAIICTILFGITVFVLSSNRFLTKIFLAAVLSLLFLEFSLLMIYMQRDATTIALWGNIGASGFSLCLLLALVLSLTYARQNYRVVLKDRRLYLAIASIFSFIAVFMTWKNGVIDTYFRHQGVISIVPTTGRYLFILWLLITIGILINVENIIRALSAASRKGKPLQRIPLYIAVGNFLFLVYAISQMLLFSRLTDNIVSASLVLTSLTSLILTIYSLKYGWVQHEIQIGREAIYSSVTIFIIGAYLFLVGVAGKIVQLAGGDINSFLSFFAAICVFCLLLATLVSRSIKTRIKSFIDRNFYKNRYDYREQWSNFSESLAAVVNLEDVLITIIKNTTQIFQASHLAFFFKDSSSGIFYFKKAVNFELNTAMKFQATGGLCDWLFRLGAVVAVPAMLNETSEIRMSDEEKANLQQLQAQVCVPMISQNKFIGILFLGKKTTGEAYSTEDFELLETIANQSSVAMLNAILNEDLMRHREMESFHKLSSFMLHDIKNSVSMLSMLITNAAVNWHNQEFQKDMMITISNAVGKMKGLMEKISPIPGRLEIKRHPAQLNQIIDDILNEMKIAELKNIYLETDFQEMPLLSIDADLIQKVIKNLFINAIEALPSGGNLWISTKQAQRQPSNNTSIKNGMAEIEIADSGPGMTSEFVQQRLFKPFTTTKKKGLGIGLYQCKEIIHAHGGTIEVRSKQTAGTMFKICLPLNSVAV